MTRTCRSSVSKWCIALLIATAWTAASAAEFSGYVKATTDYVKRGVSQSDSDASLQLGVDVRFDNGFYAGIWGSTMDFDTEPSHQRDVETNYYIGYNFDAGDRWMVGANVVSYNYPGASGGRDYDYVEYGLTANFDDTLWLEYAYSPDIYDTGFETHNYDIYAEHQLTSNWVLGGGVGYYDVSRLSGNGYGYWQAGLTRLLGNFDLDLRYHDATRAVPFVSFSELADSRIVLSVTFSF